MSFQKSWRTLPICIEVDLVCATVLAVNPFWDGWMRERNFMSQLGDSSSFGLTLSLSSSLDRARETRLGGYSLPKTDLSLPLWAMGLSPLFCYNGWRTQQRTFTQVKRMQWLLSRGLDESEKKEGYVRVHNESIPFPQFSSDDSRHGSLAASDS